MANEKQPQRNICGAKAKSTGEPCKLAAGYGTDHLGEGRCKYHGGASSGAPKKNKNAVSTGEHETIWLDTLNDKERELLPKIRTEVIDLIDDDIKLMEIRIRRMMQRINNSDEVDNIEEALTRVQGKKIRLLKLKHQVESGQGPVDVDITPYIAAVQGRAEKLWEDEE